MARRKKGMIAEDDEPIVDISSLIDVCFLLLIYFIVTSTIAEPESDLILTLPSQSSNSAEKPEIDPAFFHVLADGSINRIEAGNTSPLAGVGDPDYMHRKPESMEQLNNTVSAYSKMAGDKAVIKVKADPNVKAQYVIDLLNVLAEHKITKITFTKGAPE